MAQSDIVQRVIKVTARVLSLDPATIKATGVLIAKQMVSGK